MFNSSEITPEIIDNALNQNLNLYKIHYTHYSVICRCLKCNLISYKLNYNQITCSFCNSKLIVNTLRRNDICGVLKANKESMCDLPFSHVEEHRISIHSIKHFYPDLFEINGN